MTEEAERRKRVEIRVYWADEELVRALKHLAVDERVPLSVLVRRALWQQMFGDGLAPKIREELQGGEFLRVIEGKGRRLDLQIGAELASTTGLEPAERAGRIARVVDVSTFVVDCYQTRHAMTARITEIIEAWRPDDERTSDAQLRLDLSA